LTYTAGSYGIDEGGTVMLVQRTACDWQIPQFHHPDQAGFRKCRSTEEQVGGLIQYISDGFQLKERTAAVMVDFSRAYDRVWKEGLLAKLGRLHAPSCLVQWINGFLSDRRAFVSWGSSVSRTRIMKEGLPQGSVLAPTLWLVYINDLHPLLPRNVICPTYADDVTLATRARIAANCDRALQPALDSLSSWADSWKVIISAPKTT